MAAKKNDRKAKKAIGNAQMLWLQGSMTSSAFAGVKQPRMLKCPTCGRKTEDVINPQKQVYCAVCVGKFYETMGIKPMIDLGPVDRVVGFAETKYGKGRLKASL